MSPMRPACTECTKMSTITKVSFNGAQALQLGRVSFVLSPQWFYFAHSIGPISLSDVSS